MRDWPLAEKWPFRDSKIPAILPRRSVHQLLSPGRSMRNSMMTPAMKNAMFGIHSTAGRFFCRAMPVSETKAR